MQTLTQREFEMMKCFWESDHPMRIKELQKQWARGPDPQKWSATFTYANRLVKKGYLYKTMQTPHSVVYQTLVAKEDYYKHDLREFQKRWNICGVMRVI